MAGVLHDVGGTLERGRYCHNNQPDTTHPTTHTHTHYIPAWEPEEGEYCPHLSFGGNEERGGEEPAGPGGLSKVPIECTAVSYAAHSSPFLPNTPPLGSP